MDANTLLVVVVNGGLVIFFIYALYYIRSPVKPVKESQKPNKFVSPLFDMSSQSRTTKNEFIFRAPSEPVESPPTEIEPGA